MTNKTRLEMLTDWVKRYNPNARLFPADGRCGQRYAIGMLTERGTLRTFTDYLSLKELEQFMMGVSNAEYFLKQIKEVA